MNRVNLLFATLILAASPSSELAAALADHQTLPADVAIHARYLTTFAVPADQREGLTNATAFWCNSLSSKRNIRRPIPVGETLLRIDLRDYGWDYLAWDKLTRSDPYFGYRENYIVARADYFLVETSDTTRSNRYRDFLFGIGKQPKNIGELRKLVALDDALVQKFRVQIRHGVDEGNSGVAIHNRVLARSPTAIGGVFWESFDTKSSDGKRDIVENLLDFTFDAQEFIWVLPNGLQGYELGNAQGAIQNSAPPDIARDSTGHRVSTVDNPVSCVRCHGSASGYLVPESDLPKRLAAGVGLLAYDKDTQERIEAFYLTEDGRLMNRDKSDYAYAVSRCNGLSPEDNAKAFAAVVKNYDAPVTIEAAARELGKTVAEFRACASNVLTGRIAGLCAERSIPIPRRVWERDSYGQAKSLCGGAK